jgi:HAMP domain-containing protein
VFEELVLLNREGHEHIRVSRSQPDPTTLGDRAGTDAFVIPQTRGQVYYSPIRFEATTGEPLMSIAIPLVDARTGLVDGVLAAELRIRPIWDLIAGIRVSPGQTVYIVDAANTVVAHRKPSVVLRGTNFLVPTQDGIQLGLSGVRSVLAVERVRFEGQELNIVVEQTWSEALAMAINSLYIITVLGATFVLSGVLSFVSVRRIIRPIQTLATTAQAISAGDLSQHVQITRHDELGVLAEAFNNMTAQLRDLITGLEQRVTERTTSL